LSGDLALCLHFSPLPLPHLEATAPSPADLAQQGVASRRRNFDINRVERLAGNVGYLQLFSFEPPEWAAESLAAAMALVAHTDALILDLRHNQGGPPPPWPFSVVIYSLPIPRFTSMTSTGGPRTKPSSGGPCPTCLGPATWTGRCLCSPARRPSRRRRSLPITCRP
jgi:hypothetical protein